MQAKDPIVIVGAGIVGLATAYQLQRLWPDQPIIVLEKESQPARHQTGRNSGVIHAGVYYAPGSLKAQLCRAGHQATMTFCESENIPYQQCGKLLVATDKTELTRMPALLERARANGVHPEHLGAAALREREPHIQGLAALLVRQTGIVDYAQVAAKLAHRIQVQGAALRCSTIVTGLQELQDGIRVHTSNGEIKARFLVCCAGLQADRLVRLQGLRPTFRIVPFRGEYYRLPAHRAGWIQHLIYPIPDPALPFLGVHLTLMSDGAITLGPNAVQGWHREGYRSPAFSLADTAASLSYPGYWHFLRQHWRTGLAELHSAWSRRAYLRRVQRYSPELTLADLQPHPVGIRAQALDVQGQLLHDFLFERSRHALHVCNAPSPAATSALPIGEYIARQVLQACR